RAVGVADGRVADQVFDADIAALGHRHLDEQLAGVIVTDVREVEPLLPVPDVEALDVAARNAQLIAFLLDRQAAHHLAGAGNVDPHRAVLHVHLDGADDVVDAQRPGVEALGRPHDPAGVRPGRGSTSSIATAAPISI